MKPLFLILFSAITICVTAQSTNDTLSTVFYLRGNVNVTVRLLNKSSITGDVWRFTDSSLMMYGRNSSGDMVFKNINCAEMHSVKIKRYAFAKGAMKGTAVGSFVSNQIIENSYTDSYASSAKVMAQSASAIIASTIIGGVVNNAVTKKKFKIKGSKQRFERVFEILVRAQP